MIRNISDVQVKPEGYLLPLSIHMYENMSIMKISIGNESLYKETKHDGVTTSQAETSLIPDECFQEETNQDKSKKFTCKQWTCFYNIL